MCLLLFRTDTIHFIGIILFCTIIKPRNSLLLKNISFILTEMYLLFNPGLKISKNWDT